MDFIKKFIGRFKKEQPVPDALPDTLTEKMVRDFLTLWQTVPEKYSMSGYLHTKTDEDFNIVLCLKDEFDLLDDGNCLKTSRGIFNIIIFKPESERIKS